MLVEQRATVGLLDFFDHLRHAVGAKEGRALGPLDLAHLFSHLSALVEQAQQLLVNRVNLHAQGAQRLALHGDFALGFGVGHGLALGLFKLAHKRHQRLHTV